MYCKNCGREIVGNPKFCPFCGAPIENSQENLTTQFSEGALSKDEELKKYIKDALASGLNKEEIEAALKNVGWTQDKIKEGFSEHSLQQPSQEVFASQGAIPVQSQSFEQTQPAVVQFVHAGFWIRFVSQIIDGIIIGAIQFIVSFFVSAIILSSAPNKGKLSTEETLTAELVLRLFTLIVAWLYFALLDSSTKQGTIGKMILGLKITDSNYQRISFGRATGRYFSKMLCGLTLGIGYLMIAWDEQKQGLHDKIVNTYVIKAKED